MDQVPHEYTVGCRALAEHSLFDLCIFCEHQGTVQDRNQRTFLKNRADTTSVFAKQQAEQLQRPDRKEIVLFF